MQDVDNKTDDDNDDCIKQYLTFVLAGSVYGLEIKNIKEIIEYGDVTEVPMTPDYISGVINLRGRVVPVIDLAKMFTGKETKHTKRTSIIIVDIKGDDLQMELGATVDIVNEVIDIRSDDIDPSPPLGDQVNTRYISGMAKINDRILVLLDIENVLSTDDMSLVESINSN